jgi:hypothetical protein
MVSYSEAPGGGDRASMLKRKWLRYARRLRAG